jgi:hypothetical protein
MQTEQQEQFPAPVLEPKWVSVVSNGIAARKRPKFADMYDVTSPLPYCLHATKNPAVRCIVNRRYKAVGSPEGTTWTDYEASTDCHISVEAFEKLRYAGIVNDHGYLFHDGSSPLGARVNLIAYREKVFALLQGAL